MRAGDLSLKAEVFFLALPSVLFSAIQGNLVKSLN